MLKVLYTIEQNIQNITIFSLDGGSNNWLRYATTPIFGSASASVRYESSSLINDDWFATPQFLVHEGDILNFWVKQSTSYVDSFSVWYSTTGTTPPADWTRIGTTIVPTATASLYSIPLNSLNGQNIYIAFRYNALDQLRLYLDSVYVETPIPNDVGMFSLGLPNSLQPGTVVPTAVVKNYGSAAQTFNVTLKIDTYSSTKSVTALAPGTTSTVTFDNWAATIGDYSPKVYTELTGDGNLLNDTLTKSVRVSNYYMNGPFVTAPGGGPNGADGSALTEGLTSYGLIKVCTSELLMIS